MHAAEGLGSTDVRLGWSGPGTMFTYDEEEKAIGADLLMSLVAGLEHSRALMIREIGHSQLNTGLPPRMQKIGERIMDLQAKKDDENGEGLDDAEYKELRLLSVQWELWHRLTEAAENNTANRYTARKGENMAQDYAYSTNHTLATLTPWGAVAQEYLEQARRGEIPSYGAEPPDPAAAFMNVVNAVE